MTGHFVWQFLSVDLCTDTPYQIFGNYQFIRLHLKERQAEVPVTVTILRFTRLLLLLVFGSRPSDQTEGTFVGICDATNMAVIPQGLNEY